MDNYESFPSGELPSQQPQPGDVVSNKLSLTGVTLALLILNTLIFIVMSIKGVSFFSPTAESVLPWGADYGPLTLNGQWWRMFTSMFVHFGIIHLAFNMWVLA